MATPPYSYTDRSHLPTDVEELKNIIEYQWEEFKHYKQQKDLLIQQLMQKIESLEQELAALKRNRLGQRPEKSKKGSNQNHPGRKALPSHLKRVCIEHDLKAEEKRCPECESLLTKIKDIITEQLDMILAQLIVKEHVRARYACRKCYSTIRVADMPAQSIDKRITSSELLAHLIIEKFDYYLPCYRLEKWFARQGVNISRSTIWGWFFKCGLLLESLVEAMHQRELLIGGHLFSDDTTMPTLDPGTGKTKFRDNNKKFY